jgi:purine-binding chemotaxis protein CheW
MKSALCDLQPASPGKRRYCTFFLDGLFFGVEVERVQEVLRYQEMTPVPLAPRVVRGLINLRGQIVTALDLRRRLELPELPEGRLPMNVVVRGDDGGTSLLVDDIGDVLDVKDSAFERPPETLRGTARELIRGAYKLTERLLLVLDTDKVLNVAVEKSA